MYAYSTENLLQRYAKDPYAGKLVSILLTKKSAYEVLHSYTIGKTTQCVLNYQRFRKGWYDSADSDSDEDEDFELSAGFQKAIESFQTMFRHIPVKERLLALTFFLFETTRRHVFWPMDYTSLSHQITLKPLLQNHIFQDLLLNPEYVHLLLHTVSVLFTRNCPRAEERHEDRKKKILEEFHEAFLAVKRDFLATLRLRIGLWKKDLIAAAFHPDRVDRWLELGGHEAVEMMFA